MAVKIALADTSILIDYFRKTEKNNSLWRKLYHEGYDFSISAVTEYEIYSGATPSQLIFWAEVLKSTKVIPFDQSVARVAVEINTSLKRKRKQISFPDLFIAATAVANNIPFATLNLKHFDRIDRLRIL